MAEVKVTEANFEEEVLKSDIPCLVDFWAEWCGPCKMLGPILAEVAEEYADKIKVCKVNVDENPNLSARYKVMSIPTVIHFKKGKIQKTTVGYMDKEKLVDMFGLNKKFGLF